MDKLGCVIFDEVHFFNDINRGTVWEESIVLLPNEIQIVMLSATVDKPNLFAGWISDIKQKKTLLSSTNERIVPLSHYIYSDKKDKLYS